MKAIILPMALLFSCVSLSYSKVQPYSSGAGVENPSNQLFMSTQQAPSWNGSNASSSPFSLTSSQDNGLMVPPDGGDPIGGIPVSDGSWVLLSIAVGYSLFRAIKTRRNYQKTEL